MPLGELLRIYNKEAEAHAASVKTRWCYLSRGCPVKPSQAAFLERTKKKLTVLLNYVAVASAAGGLDMHGVAAVDLI